MKTIKIAPHLEEVKITGNIVSAEFRGMSISYSMPEDKCAAIDPVTIKQNFCAGIALSSKLWFLEDLLNHRFLWEGKLKVTSLENGEVLYETK